MCPACIRRVHERASQRDLHADNSNSWKWRRRRDPCAIRSSSNGSPSDPQPRRLRSSARDCVSHQSSGAQTDGALFGLRLGSGCGGGIRVVRMIDGLGCRDAPGGRGRVTGDPAFGEAFTIDSLAASRVSGSPLGGRRGGGREISAKEAKVQGEELGPPARYLSTMNAVWTRADSGGR